MNPWLWRWVEPQVRTHLPTAQQSPTLGDLLEDYGRHRRRAGRVASAVWLIRECRDLSRVYRTDRFPTSTRRFRMPSWHFPELRLALRRIYRQPAASLAAVATLAMAFAAALATWILIDTVLLTPVPAATQPDRLLVVGERFIGRDGGPGRVAHHLGFSRLALVRESGLFAQVAAIGSSPALVGDRDKPVPRDVAFVSANFFDTLGVRPALGRVFLDDDRDDAGTAAVIAHRFWQTEYDQRRDVLGKTIRVGDTVATIVGIAPANFSGVSLQQAPDVFLPARSAYDVLGRGMDYLEQGLPGTSPMSMFTIIGRLPDGRTREQLGSALGLTNATPEARLRSLEAVPLNVFALPETARPRMEQFTRMLAATVGLLLLIGMLSVGLLVLIRSEGRREELAMCLALGASRGRLMRGVLAEGGWLSIAGIALAGPLTAALLAAARQYELPGRISIAKLTLNVDARVVILALVFVVLATVMVGLVAGGVGLGGSVADVLRARSGATARLTRRRTRQALIVAQVAVAMVLMVGTGLFARSLAAALRLNDAYAPADVVTTSLGIQGLGYSPAKAISLFASIREKVAELPGVEAVAFRTSAGGMGAGGTVTMSGEKREIPSSLSYVHVDERYFGTIGLPIMAGRDFAPSDIEGAELVGVVSASLGRFISRGGDAVGMTIAETSRRIGTSFQVVRIVGVVPDVVTNVNSLEPLVLYYTVRQKPTTTGPTLHVRSGQEAAVVGREVRHIIETIDDRIVLSDFLTLRDLIKRQMAPQQFGIAVLGSLAAVALLLTLLGTYVIAETMAKARERELGVRAALGATAPHLGGLVLTESAVLIGLGIAGGLGLTWLAASTVEALLYQTEAFDVPAVAAAGGAILVLALLVSIRPALRASRVDIARLLRE
jgi:predicted permease